MDLWLLFYVSLKGLHIRLDVKRTEVTVCLHPKLSKHCDCVCAPTIHTYAHTHTHTHTLSSLRCTVPAMSLRFMIWEHMACTNTSGIILCAHMIPLSSSWHVFTTENIVFYLNNTNNSLRHTSHTLKHNTTAAPLTSLVGLYIITLQTCFTKPFSQVQSDFHVQIHSCVDVRCFSVCFV